MPSAQSEVPHGLASLPPFPAVTAKLLRVLDDDRVSLEEIAELVSSDPSLSIKIIKMANSPFYAVQSRVRTVHEGVMILGLNTVKTMTIAVSLTDGLRHIRPPQHSFDWLKYWQHSYATAIACYKLFGAKQRQLRDQAFLIGMVHDIGKLIQAFSLPESWRSLEHACLNSGLSYESAEIQFLGGPAWKIAVQLCHSWNFPADIVLGIEMLGSPASTDDASLPHRRGLAIAHDLAERAGFAFPIANTGTSCNIESSPELERIVTSLPGDVATQVSILGIEE